MFYLFKRPADNSRSSAYELVAETYDHARIETLRKAFMDLGHYDLLLVAEVPREREDDGESIVMTHTRPD